MKILITGSAGFIGHSLIKKCIENGLEVFGVDYINDYYDVRLKHARLADQGFSNIQNATIQQSQVYKNLSFFKMDLNDRDRCNQFFKKPLI